MAEREKLIEVKDLQISFGKGRKKFVAVDHVNFDIYKGETFSLVGESGSGKTTIGRAITRINPTSAGEIYFKGKKINGKISKELDREVIKSCQMIFQDPYSSLSPRMTVGEIVSEAVRQHKIVPKTELRSYVLDMMEKCGLQAHHYDRYPHEFSGGQRQRICIVKALALKPKLVICDEPVSALDVSIQAQVINLLKDLQEKHGQAYIFISHDLSVVEHISDEVGVMYLGSMVEYGSKADLFAQPLHPYTRALFSAVPIPDPDVKLNRIHLGGDIPSPANPPAGCKFHTRCPECRDICKQVSPIMRDMGGGHCVACHLYDGVTHLDPPAPGTVFAGGGNQSADSRQAPETQDPLPGKSDGADSAR